MTHLHLDKFAQSVQLSGYELQMVIDTYIDDFTHC